MFAGNKSGDDPLMRRDDYSAAHLEIDARHSSQSSSASPRCRRGRHADTVYFDIALGRVPRATGRFRTMSEENEPPTTVASARQYEI